MSEPSSRPASAGNVARAKEILRALAAKGCRHICLCAGARNAPFVAALEQARGLETASFFEERSAAFFALGRARRDRRPVAVVVTSGTAAAELLPAAVEAKHSGVPLVLITADRPRRLRGTGAPQTIEQVGLYSSFVEAERDLEGEEALDLSGWSAASPLHLNVCFDEPLIDEAPAPWRADPAEAPDWGRRQESGWGREIEAVEASLAGMSRPLVIASGLETEAERDGACALALALKAPLYAESTSGLREDPRLAGLRLSSGDRILQWGIKRGLFDGVLRVGGVPTARVWRDLEAPSSRVPVASVSRLPFPGLSRCVHAWGPLEELASRLAASASAKGFASELVEKDAEASRALRHALADLSRSEPSLVRALSSSASASASVYLGNSLPIREWDLAAAHDRPRWTAASRGANGIDGQVSAFLGGLRDGEEGWALLGDLTALYDLVGPWALPYVAGAKPRVAVINNGGGKIFSRIFGNPLFENRHALRFESFAKAWGMDYALWTEAPADAGAGLGAAALVEIAPDPTETDAFWSRYDAIWTSK